MNLLENVPKQHIPTVFEIFSRNSEFTLQKGTHLSITIKSLDEYRSRDDLSYWTCLLCVIFFIIICSYQNPSLESDLWNII